MTTGETAFLVILTLSFFVVPLVLFVWYGQKYSDETFEPVYQPRTYRTSAWYYFLSVDLLWAIFLLAFGTFLTTILSQPLRIGDSTPSWVVYSIFLLLVLLCSGAASYILYIYANYWKHTKDRILTFDPQARTLTIYTDEDEYMISEEDIERVDIFSNENYKNPYSYYLFKLRDGREFIITDKTKGALAIFEFFKNLPFHSHKRRIPTIS